MGTVSLPSLDAIMQIKDQEKRFAELVNTLGILIKNLSEINGYITSKNIKKKSIEADRIGVVDLSAINANLGHIISGLIEAVTMIGSEIYGSLISTNQFGYPRAVMSNTENHFRASTDASRYIDMSSFFLSTGSPLLSWREGANFTESFLSGGLFRLSSSGDMSIQTLQEIGLIASKVSFPYPGGVVEFSSWSQLRNASTGRTLQQDLDNLQSQISGVASYAASLDARITALGG